MGPVISAAQQERVLGFLDRAKGATVLTGGGSVGSRGFFVSPTVVAGVAQSDEIVQREGAGPVVTVQRFEDDEQALASVNDVLYGARIGLTRDAGRALNAARKLQVRHGLDRRPGIPLASAMPIGCAGLQADRLTASGPLLHLLEDYTPDQARDG